MLIMVAPFAVICTASVRSLFVQSIRLESCFCAGNGGGCLHIKWSSVFGRVSIYDRISAAPRSVLSTWLTTLAHALWLFRCALLRLDVEYVCLSKCSTTQTNRKINLHRRRLFSISRDCLADEDMGIKQVARLRSVFTWQSSLLEKYYKWAVKLCKHNRHMINLLDTFVGFLKYLWVNRYAP